MSERVPEGWSPKDLGEIAKFSGGSAFKEIYQGISTGSYPFIKVSDMNLLGNERYMTKANNWISEEIVNQAKIKLFPLDTTVFAKVGAALLLNRRRQLVRDTAIDNNMMAAVPFNCEPGFLNYFMQTIDLANIVQSGAVPSVNQNQMESIPVNTPPLPEQKKIASILTSVDEVIETTQKQIDKLQDLKKATMNELLTKGIGHSEFKDSELGRIPKSWEVRFLDDVTKRGSGHTPAKQNPSYWNGGVKWVSLADSSRLDKGFIYETDKEISEEGLANSSAVLHPEGTVVLSRDAGIGKSAVLAEEMAVSQHFMAWRCENRTDNWFLYYWMQKTKPMFETVAIGSTIKTIGLGYFKQLKMAYPPLQEQKSIATKLLSIDKHIGKLNGKLAQTQSLKKSLMQDLLTGKVRVQVN